MPRMMMTTSSSIRVKPCSEPSRARERVSMSMSLRSRKLSPLPPVLSAEGRPLAIPRWVIGIRTFSPGLGRRAGRRRGGGRGVGPAVSNEGGERAVGGAVVEEGSSCARARGPRRAEEEDVVRDRDPLDHLAVEVGDGARDESGLAGLVPADERLQVLLRAGP